MRSKGNAGLGRVQSGLAAAIFVGFVGAMAAQADNVRVSSEGGRDDSPTIARESRDHLFIAYSSRKQWDATVPRNQMKIWVQHSRDGGQTWEFFAGLHDEDDVQDYLDPVVVVSTASSHVHVAYEKAVAHDQHEVWVATFNAGGGQLKDLRVGSGSYHDHSASLAVAAGGGERRALLLAYQVDKSDDDTDIVVYESLDGGLRWSREKTFGATSSDVFMGPWIDIGPNADTVALAFGYQYLSTKKMLVCRRQNDSWDSSPTVIEQGSGSRYEEPKISVDCAWPTSGSRMMVAYRQSSGIRYAYSTDGGASWSSAARLIRASSSTQFDLVVFDGRAFLTYTDDDTVWLQTATFPDLSTSGWGDRLRVSDNKRQDVDKPRLVREPLLGDTDPEITWTDNRVDHSFDIYKAPPYAIPGSVIGLVVDQTISEAIPDADVELYDDTGDRVDKESTEDDGSFEFGEVEPGRYYLVVSHPDYLETRDPETSTFTVGSAARVDRGAIALTPEAGETGDVEGSTIDAATSAGIADATVQVFRESGLAEEVETAADGSFAATGLDPGEDYYLVLSADGYAAARDPVSGSFSVEAGRTTDRGDIELTPVNRPAISGFIKERESGDPIPDAQVLLYNDAGALVGTAYSDPAGYFIFERLAVDCYYLQISADDYESRRYPSGDTSYVCLTSTSDSEDCGDIRLSPAAPDRGSVRGTVVDGQSLAPVEGATVSLYASAGALVDTALTEAGSGEFLFSEVWPKYYYLQIVKAGYQDARDPEIGVFAVGEGELVDRGDIPLDPVPTTGVTGTIVEAGSDDAVPGARVSLRNAAGAEQAGDLSGGDGTFLFSDIPPGSYYLLVTKTGHEDLRDPDLGTFSVSAGQLVDRGELPLTPILSSIVGTVVSCETAQPIAAAAVQLLEAGNTPVANAATDVYGSFSFTDVDPGDYYLLIVASGRESRREPSSGTFHLAEGERVDRGEVCLYQTGGGEGSVEGQLVEGEGEPVAGADVNLHALGKEPVDSTVSGSDGSFELRGVALGEYYLEIVAEGEDFATSSRHPLTGTLDVTAGQTTSVGQCLVPKLETVLSHSVLGSSPTGIAWDGEHLWTSSFADCQIHKVDPASGSVVQTFDAPGSESAGLAFDGTHLWNVDPGNQRIYKIDSTTGLSLGHLDTPSATPRGLDYDGTYLWYTDPDEQRVYQIDHVTGAAVDSLHLPGTSPRGVACTDDAVYVADGVEDVILEIQLTDGTVSARLRAPGSSPEGMTWTGSYLWHIDRSSCEALKLVTGREAWTAGDLDGDGCATIMDAYMAALAEAGMVTLSCAQEWVGDVDRSGAVSIVDAFQIALAEAGVLALDKPGPPPCP